MPHLHPRKATTTKPSGAVNQQLKRGKKNVPDTFSYLENFPFLLPEKPLTLPSLIMPDGMARWNEDTLA